jgi:hypothetical protein
MAITGTILGLGLISPERLVEHYPPPHHGSSLYRDQARSNKAWRVGVRIEGLGGDGDADHALRATFCYFVGFHSREGRCASAI